MYTVGIVTSSDKCSRGEVEDTCGKKVKEILELQGFSVERYVVLPDEIDILSKELMFMSDVKKSNLVITIGGVGISSKDITPIATNNVIDIELEGVSEAIRNYCLSITKSAMFLRGKSGVRRKTIIVNLPNDYKLCKEILTFILEELKHGIDIIKREVRN
ncbi:MogA/MoaB family molybdenum cofactor biosynthesis protein [Clostridium carnis]